jgi:Fic family protein
LLLAVTAQEAWEEWVLYVLAGVSASSKETVLKIQAIKVVQENFAYLSRQISRGGADSEMQAALFEQPYCRISTIINRCGVSRPTATKWLDALVIAGLLSDVKVGRDRLFINHQLLDALSGRNVHGT